MCICTFPFFFTAKILVIAAPLLDWSEDLCCSCPIAELGSPHLPTYHFCCLMVPTLFQNLSPVRELPSSNFAYCRAQILPPTSAHSPGLLQVLQSSCPKPASPIFSSAHQSWDLPVSFPESTPHFFTNFPARDSFPMRPALIHTETGLCSSTTAPRDCLHPRPSHLSVCCITSLDTSCPAPHLPSIFPILTSSST